MVKKVFKSAILIMMILIISIEIPSLALGPAISVGTVNNTGILSDGSYSTITTTSLIEYAADCYSSCGYVTSKKLSDPTYMMLLSNAIASEIQLYSTHGSIDSITYTSKTGIADKEKVSGGAEYIGLSNLYNGWKSNAKLIIYMACNTGGEDGIASNNSLCYLSTVAGGAPACMGLKKEVSYSRGVKPWSDKFHDALSKGYGVKSALESANNGIYSDNNIKSWHYVYDSSETDVDFKIGRYNTQDLNMIDLSVVDEKNNIIKNKELNNCNQETITNEIKSYDQDFDINNYMVEENVGTITEINNRKIVNEVECKTISYVLKVGDFRTNAGYVVNIIDGQLEGIYDRNIDVIKQKEMIEDIDNYRVKLPLKNKDSYIEKSKKQINIGYNIDNATSSEENVTYYCDINTGKKYMQVDVKSQIDDDIAVDTIEYEI